MEDIIIDVQKLACMAGRKYLLKSINWQVKRGEHWVVFGMNGSGKTTLLSIIAGYKPFTHGSVKVFGEPFDDENIMAFRRRIGWVSGSFFDRYYSREPALDIVLSGKFGALGLRGDISNEDIKRAKLLLSELGIGDKISQPFSTMSKGERQNVLIARALLCQPEILVLDEPCTGLDILARDRLLDTVRYLAKETDVTIIYVTHYTEEIIDVFGKGLLLKNGHLVAQGETKMLFTSENMSDFLGHRAEVIPREDNQFQVKARQEITLGQMLEGVKA